MRLSMVLLLLFPLMTSAEADSSEGLPAVLHGTLEANVEENLQLTMVLDLLSSEYSRPDGIADYVFQFLPLEGEELPSEFWKKRSSHERVTVEKQADGVTVVLGKGQRYRLLVPENLEAVSLFQEQSNASVITGYGLSWSNVRGLNQSNEQVLEERSAGSLLDCGQDTGVSASQSLDCTTGGPGAISCSVSCPLGMGCSVRCLAELGYYACCSCYTGCGCKLYNEDPL